MKQNPIQRCLPAKKNIGPLASGVLLHLLRGFDQTYLKLEPGHCMTSRFTLTQSNITFEHYGFEDHFSLGMPSFRFFISTFNFLTPLIALWNHFRRVLFSIFEAGRFYQPKWHVESASSRLLSHNSPTWVENPETFPGILLWNIYRRHLFEDIPVFHTRIFVLEASHAQRNAEMWQGPIVWRQSRKVNWCDQNSSHHLSFSTGI